MDATVGLGGHAEKILSVLGNSGTLIGIDRDETSLRCAGERLGSRAILRKGRFSDLGAILEALGIGGVDGVLLDLGVSMLHFTDMDRGFSFLSTERIDMRMDRQQKITGWEVVNTYPQARLETVLREYGEEPHARAVARAIVAARQRASIDTCKDLATVVSGACRRHGRTHPATRTFQAIRIEVNNELAELEGGLRAALSVLKRGGRLCVISYHSLEDRIVKNFMRGHARTGELRVLTKKPTVAERQERVVNPSSRSARLRGAEKI